MRAFKAHSSRARHRACHLWEGAHVLRSGTIKSGAGNSWSAILSTTDPYIDVYKGVAAGFQKAGWDVQALDASTAEASTTVLTVTESKGAGVVTIVAQKDKSTRINYVMTSKGK